MAFGHNTFAEFPFAAGDDPIAGVPTQQLILTFTAPTRVVSFNFTIPTEDLIVTSTSPSIVAYVPAAANSVITPTAPSRVTAFFRTTPRINLTIILTSPIRVRTTGPAPAETPWRDEDALTDGWTEESEAA